MGFFGYTPRTKDSAGQPLHSLRVDIGAAATDAAKAVNFYTLARLHTNAPAFTGGVLDAWPAWAVTAFAVIREEEQRVRAWLNSERREQPTNG